MKKILVLLLSLVMMFVVVGCSSSTDIQSIDGDKVYQMIQNKDDFVLVDVREQDEYDAGHIEGAMLIPLGTIETDFVKTVPSKDQMIVVYCRTGRRSQEAYAKIKDLGYQDVYDLGGIVDWKYDVVK